MLSKIVRFLERQVSDAAEADADEQFDRRQVAAAALMVEASRLDTDYDANERATIKTLIANRFNLSPAQTDALIQVAEKRSDEVYSDWMFTQAIASGFSEDERADILAMLWEVAFADGSLHRFEEHMIRRVCAELGLDEAACDAARAKALKTLGMTDPKRV